jgi:hypothetical protein
MIFVLAAVMAVAPNSFIVVRRLIVILMRRRKV